MGQGIPQRSHPRGEWVSFRTTVNMSLGLSLGGPLAEAVASSRVLVVGTGGIGCELLKNLVLTGFQNIVAVSAQFLLHFRTN